MIETSLSPDMSDMDIWEDVTDHRQWRSTASPYMADRDVYPTSVTLSRSGLRVRDPAIEHRVNQQLNGLLQLGRGWDSYDAEPVNRAIADMARHILISLVAYGFPSPQVVPTAAGGLSIEWHRPRRELVLELSPNRRSSAYFVDEEQGREWEMTPPDEGRLLPELMLMEG